MSKEKKIRKAYSPPRIYEVGELKQFAGSYLGNHPDPGKGPAIGLPPSLPTQ